MVEPSRYGSWYGDHICFWLVNIYVQQPKVSQGKTYRIQPKDNSKNGCRSTACKERLKKLGFFSCNQRTWRSSSTMVFKNKIHLPRRRNYLDFPAHRQHNRKHCSCICSWKTLVQITWKNFPIVKLWWAMSREWRSLQPSSTVDWIKNCQEWWWPGETHWRDRGGRDIFSGSNPGVGFCHIVYGAAWGQKLCILGIRKKRLFLLRVVH